MSHDSIPVQSELARIINPQNATLVGRDVHLPPLNIGQLNASTLSQALSLWRDVEPLAMGDGNRFEGRSIRSAAVLLGIVQRDGQLNLILTQRAAHLRNHAGQIALPGGAQDASDIDSWHTAQREAREEVGLLDSHMQYLGRFHTYTTVTAFEVTPCVAWVEPQVQYTPAASEVAQVFEVPLSHVLNPANHERRSITTPVGNRLFYAIPSHDCSGQERFIWGATAGILRNLYALLAVNHRCTA